MRSKIKNFTIDAIIGGICLTAGVALVISIPFWSMIIKEQK
tara:strand:- start:436 stop:558 length:123 start_codon:yes stop_codon:yes gene_type:complete